jgi:uncharacterized membrane protein
MIVDLILKQKNTTPKSEGVERSILKTISWRVIGTLDTFFIAYMVTGTFNHAVSIGGFELITKMILYFFHERSWNKIQWGKNI